MPASPLVLNSAALMSESIVVGAFAVLTALVLWLLVKRRKTMPISQKILFGVAVVMFGISIAHLGLVFSSITTKSTIKNGQARVILAVFQFVLGDLILIWRLWIVWARNYWVALPPLIIMAIAAAFQLKIGSDVYLLAHESYFGVASPVLIVANTCICTILIAGKIWHTRYRLSSLTKVATPGFSGGILLFIETGALYAASQICGLILNHVKSDGLHILLDIELPLIGILPTLIIVVVHFELTGPDPTAPSHPLSTLRFGGKGEAFVNTMASTTTAREDDSPKQETPGERWQSLQLDAKIDDTPQHSVHNMV